MGCCTKFKMLKCALQIMNLLINNATVIYHYSNACNPKGKINNLPKWMHVNKRMI